MRQLEKLQILKQEKTAVSNLEKSQALLARLTGETGINNLITNKNLYRPQLALAGYVGLFNYHSVQLFGNTEIYYLRSLTKKKKIEAFNTLTSFPIPCIILTNDHELDPELLEIALSKNIAVFKTPYDTSKATFLLTEYLDDQFAPQAVIHGSFVDVYGIGILFLGRSGIGKSEIALDLIERGHRLVADDVVMLTKKHETILMGTGTNLVQHFMEIRGLGIIDIKQMFGIRSIRYQKRLEIIVELEEFNPMEEYTRLGIDDEPVNILGVEISNVKLPIFPGKNITVIAEVIAVHYLLRTYGYNPARVFSSNQQERIRKKTGPGGIFEDMRNISYFQSDNE